MKHPSACSFTLVPFSIVYQNKIRHQLEEIDIFIKVTTGPYEKSSICKLLNIKPKELTSIVDKHKIDTLNKISLFAIILNGSSTICKLIQREFKTGHKNHYSPADIAYIYDLKIENVRDAVHQTGHSHIDSNNIIDVFKYIYVPISRY